MKAFSETSLYLREGRLVKGVATIAVILVLVLVGVPMVAHFASTSPRAQSSSSLERTSSSANNVASQSTSSSAGKGLTITNMYADVISFEQQALDSNSSSVAGKTIFNGRTGETFTVVIDITYQACGAGACPKQVTSVDTTTPGFVVVATTPSLPLRLAGAGGDFLGASFTVDVRAPATPYTGILTLVVHAG
jgi:hypothetical protein